MAKASNKGKTTRTEEVMASAATVVEETTYEGAPVVEEKKSFIPKEIDPNQIVTVRNGFQGRLVYRSRRTGERFVWDEFGAEQDMELSELKNAKNSNKKYFMNNWFMFDEQWVIDYLGLKQFYKHAIPVDKFDELFEKTPEEIEDAVSKLSAGQKKSVAYRARQLISEGGIDSNRVISALERCLGVDLVER